MNTKFKMYSVDDKKQAELDALQNAITQTQYTVDQWQVISDATQSKQNQFEALTEKAKSDYDKALSNLSLANKAVSVILEMVLETSDVAQQTYKTNQEVNKTADCVSSMVNQLIFSVEVLNRLALLINKKQASGVVVTDEIVSSVNTANGDANNAVALSLTALDSCFTATASSDEAEAITKLEQKQSLELFRLLVGNMDEIKAAFDALNTLNKARREHEREIRSWKDALSLHGMTLGDPLTYYQQIDTEELKAQGEAAKEAASNAESALKQTDLSRESLEEYTERHLNYLQAQELAEQTQQIQESVTELEESKEKLDKAEADYNEKIAALVQVIGQPGRVNAKEDSLYSLLSISADQAKDKYKLDRHFLELVKREHELATQQLQETTNKLNALKAGLKAAIAIAAAT